MTAPKTLCACLVVFACAVPIQSRAQTAASQTAASQTADETSAQTVTVTQDQPSTPNPDSGGPRLQPGSARGLLQRHAPQLTATPNNDAQPQILLTVPKGTSLQVALEKELRVSKIGQSVDALLVEPVYAFDRLVVPAGAKIHGEVIGIEHLSGGKRTLASLDGDFTPVREITVQFTSLTLRNGTLIPIRTTVTPGSGRILKFVSTPEKEAKESKTKKATELKRTVTDAASERTKEAKQLAQDEWNNAMKQLKTPGRIHRLQRYAESQLPVHRQYIPAGTMYFAELEQPLDFGKEPMTPKMAESFGGALPDGSVVHARLLTALSSATAQKGQEVEAVLTQPLFDGERFLLPQGSILKGTVRQVRAARRLKKNGQLRIAFQQVVAPDGIEQKVQAALVGVQAGKDRNVRLDSEGGAEATTSKSRYASVALSLGLAMASAHVHDRDGAPGPGGPGGGTGSRAAGGLGGFKLVGAVMGVFVKSRAVGYTMGGYGAGMSIYRNFLARGHDIVFPKNTAMEIGIGTRAATSASASEPLELATAESANDQ